MENCPVCFGILKRKKKCETCKKFSCLSCSVKTQTGFMCNSCNGNPVISIKLKNNQVNSSKLFVRVIEAKGLEGKDINLLANKSSDPYVKIELENSKFESSVKEKTLEPFWDETFIFEIKNLNGVLNISVFDRDGTTKDDFLGSCEIPLRNLEINRKVKGWLNLNTKGSIKLAIFLQCSFMFRIFDSINKEFLIEEKKYPEFSFNEIYSPFMTIVEIFYFRFFGHIVNFFQNILSWKNFAFSIFFSLFILFFLNFINFWIPLFSLAFFFWHFHLFVRRENEISFHSSSLDFSNPKVGTFVSNLASILPANVKKFLISIQPDLESLSNFLIYLNSLLTWKEPGKSLLLTFSVFCFSIFSFFIPFKFFLFFLWIFFAFRNSPPFKILKGIRNAFFKKNEKIKFSAEPFFDSFSEAYKKKEKKKKFFKAMEKLPSPQSDRRSIR